MYCLENFSVILPWSTCIVQELVQEDDQEDLFFDDKSSIWEDATRGSLQYSHHCQSPAQVLHHQEPGRSHQETHNQNQSADQDCLVTRCWFQQCYSCSWLWWCGGWWWCTCPGPAWPGQETSWSVAWLECPGILMCSSCSSSPPPSISHCPGS